jgi:hypothetical protein
MALMPVILAIMRSFISLLPIHFPTSRSICQTLTYDALHRFNGTLFIVAGHLDPVRITEVELCQIPV